MTKLTSLSNKWFKNSIKILSLSTIGFVFQACYGIPSDYSRDVEIEITVLDPEGNPLSDIEVKVNDFISRTTDENGVFQVYSPQYDEYKVRIVGNEIYHSFDTVLMNDTLVHTLSKKLQKK